MILEGKSRALIRDHNANAWLAYHTAALTRLPPKRFPKLSALQHRPRVQRQTWQEQLAIAQMYAARGVGRMKHKVN